MTYWLPDKIYDSIKWIVTTVLPALSVAYVGLAAVWGWPYADEVSRTAAVVYTLLCALMGISSATATAVSAPDETSELGRHMRG